MKIKFGSYLTATVFLIACCGCINHDSTVYTNPDRVKVAFENESAGRIFYETLSKTSPTPNRRESNTSIEIPVVFSHHSHVVEGENVAFNNAVKQCDTNQDGIITETEARIFAEQRQKSPH
ncbi:hypothetical protein [Pedosphaera parvula]|uniref:Uncharacterized protein n=1 Tax=Pedosphaera parvula (strain Ellin514) TaxID=320771 RepID=B9XP55_PEDPL|nr:hypothetical protein [Pedosphaera parvula]EEF58411.1 hypothetical protein Cflav_PD6154 [Pedosphaera parvula Ellin514]